MPVDSRRVCILLPTYNGARTLQATLDSLLTQSFKDFYVVAEDDASTDATPSLLLQQTDPRVMVFLNSVNVGYPGNLRRANSRVRGAEFIYLLGQDDLLHVDALKWTMRAFEDTTVTAVTRPYFWFEGSVDKVIRVKLPISGQNGNTVYLDEGSEPRDVVEMFRTTDQLTGLALRRTAISQDFHDHVFPCHVYPFASCFKVGRVAVLAEYPVAIRTESSQSRSVSEIYKRSPAWTWRVWLDSLFPEDSPMRRALLRDFIGRNAVGLVQIRTYAPRPLRATLREIWELLKARPANALSGQFLVVGALCLVVPARILRWMSDLVKRRIIGPVRRPAVSTYWVR